MQEIPADFSPLSLDPFPTAWPHVYVARQKQDTYHRRSQNDDQDDCKKKQNGGQVKSKINQGYNNQIDQEERDSREANRQGIEDSRQEGG